MLTEDIAKQGKVGVDGRDLAIVGSKGGAESLERGGRSKLIDFIDDLLRYQFTFKIFIASAFHYSCRPRAKAGNAIQCSCFPVSVWPGGSNGSFVGRLCSILLRMGRLVSVCACVALEGSSAIVWTEPSKDLIWV